MKDDLIKNKNNIGINAEEIDEVDKVKMIKERKSNYVCVFCGGTKRIRLYCGKYICADCYNDLKKIYASRKRKK